MRNHGEPVIHTVLNASDVPKLDLWPRDIVLLVGQRPSEDMVGIKLSTGEIEWERRHEEEAAVPVQVCPNAQPVPYVDGT